MCKVTRKNQTVTMAYYVEKEKQRLKVWICLDDLVAHFYKESVAPKKKDYEYVLRVMTFLSDLRTVAIEKLREEKVKKRCVK